MPGTAAGTVFRMSVHGTIFVHFVPILVWKGETQQTAANLIGLLALSSVPLIILFGWLSDRLGRQRLLAACYISASLSLLLLTIVEGTWPIFAAMMLFTGTEIGSGLNWALVGDLFGRKRYATIRGLLAPIYNVALFTMPVAAGRIFDETGSYRIVLIAGAAPFRRTSPCGGYATRGSPDRRRSADRGRRRRRPVRGRNRP